MKQFHWRDADRKARARTLRISLAVVGALVASAVALGLFLGRDRTGLRGVARIRGYPTTIRASGGQYWFEGPDGAVRMDLRRPDAPVLENAEGQVFSVGVLDIDDPEWRPEDKIRFEFPLAGVNDVRTLPLEPRKPESLSEPASGAKPIFDNPGAESSTGKRFWLRGDWDWRSGIGDLVVSHELEGDHPTLAPWDRMIESARFDVADELFDVEYRGALMFAAVGKAGLVILDVSTGVPAMLSTSETRAPAIGIALAGDYALVATSKGLETLDVSDPAKPVPGARFAESEIRKGLGPNPFPGQSDIDADGGFAYLACGSGLVVYDCSNPARPRRLGFVREPLANVVDASDGYVHVGFRHISETCGLQTIYRQTR